MIVSHKHKFIFIKTRKTAGTSIEIALSTICGEDDIITPITAQDERLRHQMGGRPPQNYVIDRRFYRLQDWLWALYKQEWREFYNHAPAYFIKRYLPTEIWQTYYKFCFERNPYDKVVSDYYWRYQNDPKPDVSDHLASPAITRLQSYSQYSIGGEVTVDDVFRYEDLSTVMPQLAVRFGVSDLSLPNAKSGYRKKRATHSELFSKDDYTIVERVFAKEIALMGYVPN